MGCICCCPLSEEEQQERRPILAEVSHTLSEPISIHSSPLGKDAYLTELTGTPLDPRTIITHANEKIIRDFCERVIPHDANFINYDVIDDRVNRREHFQNEYLGNIRIEPTRRHSIRFSLPEITQVDDRGEIEDLTTDLINRIRAELVEKDESIVF